MVEKQCWGLGFGNCDSLSGRTWNIWRLRWRFICWNNHLGVGANLVLIRELIWMQQLRYQMVELELNVNGNGRCLFVHLVILPIWIYSVRTPHVHKWKRSYNFYSHTQIVINSKYRRRKCVMRYCTSLTFLQLYKETFS